MAGFFWCIFRFQCIWGQQLLYQRIPYVTQAFQQQRMKDSALSVKDHFHCCIRGICRLIAPFTGERIIDICQGDHLCRERDGIPLQAIRITAAVISLMMPPADFICRSQQRFVPVNGQIHKYLRACHRMALHNLKFLCRKTAWLIENLFRDGDFANIMQCRSHADHGNVFVCHFITVRF